MSIRANLQNSSKWIILSAVVILSAGLVTYHPSLNIGFWTDDYWLLEMAGRLSLPDYLASWFYPQLQWRFYRPMQGFQWWIGYTLFRSQPFGYHLVQLLLHLANGLLLFDLTTHFTRRWRIGLVAALVYVTLQVDSLAVLWLGVVDPLVTCFFLLAIRLWVIHLETRHAKWYALAFAAYVAALLSKEIAATLPVLLFLAGQWLIGGPLTLNQAIKRYALFVLAWLMYALVEAIVVSHSIFTRGLGYEVGGHIVPGLIHQLGVLAFPWGADALVNYGLLLVVLVLLGYGAIKRKLGVIFLGMAVVLTLLPVLPFPSNIALTPRYLYLPLIGSAVGVALLFEGTLGVGRNLQWRWISSPLAFGIALLIGWGSLSIGEGAVNFGGTARQARLQFRPIFQAHPTFAPDTLLYFINPPLETPYTSGLFFLRYGANVSVDGSDSDHFAELRKHSAGWIFYLDDNQIWREQAVDKISAASAIPKLPLRFTEPIALEGFELASERLQRGGAVVLILYWRPTGKVQRDYTVFVHLVDEKGQLAAGYDGQPRQGAKPTSTWSPADLITDGMVIPIDDSIPPREYKLEVGLYDLATMQRLLLLDTQGQPITDKVVIGPISIVE